MTIFKLVPLKHLCREPVAYGSNISSESYSSTGIRFLRTTDITDRGDLLPPDRGVYVDERLVRDSLLQDGDLLLSRSGTIGRSILFREAVHGPCAHAGYLVRFRPRPDIDPRWLFYFSKTSTFSDQIAEDVVESTIANFNGQKFANLAVPLPPRDCQYRIADFLDRKTASIDTLIAKQEQLLELLAEKRQALITQAVTKGLDPNVPMKDSGIPWLGEIPKHWAVVRVSYVAEVRNGSTPDRNNDDYWVDGCIPWLSSGKVNDFVVTEADELITERALRETSVRVLRKGTVLVGMVGQGRTRGMSAIMALDACINQNVAGVTARPPLLDAYLHFVFVTAYDSLRELGRGGQQDALNCEIIKAFRIPLPPLDEQRRIVEYVESELRRLDSLSQRVQAMIERLCEYRQALITAAVTGQLDVTPTIHSERRPSPQAEAV